MTTRGMVTLGFIRRLRGIFCGLILSVSLTGQGWTALSDSTKRVGRLIAQHDFRGIEPAMDTQQQFIVFSPDTRLSRELLRVALELKQKIYYFFSISKVWEEPAFILIFPSKERYGLYGSKGAAISFKYRGQKVRMIASYLQEGLEHKILPHEMVHFLVADLSMMGSGSVGRQKPPQLPVFINEGIAEYFSASGGRRILFEESVRESLQAGRLESMEKIVTSTATWVEGLRGANIWEKRAQAYSLISFLVSLPNGNVKLRNYILSYGTSARWVLRRKEWGHEEVSAPLKAFEMAFGRDYSSLEKLHSRWVQFIRDREIVVINAGSALLVDSSGEVTASVGGRMGHVLGHRERMLSRRGRLRSRRGGLPSQRERLRSRPRLFRARGPGSFLRLEASMPNPGAYDVYAVYTRGPRCGRFRLALNGRELPGIFDGYASKQETCDPVYHGKSVIPGGTMTLRFSVVGKQAISGGFDVQVNCLVFRRDRHLEERNRAAARRHLQSGIRDYRLRRFREAEASFSAAVGLLPWDALALEWRAHARIAMGKLDEARQDVEAAIKLQPENRRLSELRRSIENARKGPSNRGRP